MIANILNWISGFFQNLLSVVLKFFSSLFGFLINSIFNFLKLLFKPILILIALIFYVIYKIGELIVSLVMVIVGIGKLLYSFLIGIFSTLGSLSWNDTTPQHGSWTITFNQVFDSLELFQLDKIAYVVSFIIWISTAFAVIKILSAEGS